MSLKSKYITCITNEKPFEHDLTRGKRYKVEYDSEHRFTVINDQKQTVSYFKNRFVTFDVDEMKAVPDGSVRDAETIRQIGLYGYTADNSLFKKIKPSLEFCALYPEVIKSYDHSTSKFNEFLDEFRAERQNKRVQK